MLACPFLKMILKQGIIPLSALTPLVVPPSIGSVLDEMPDKINSSFTLGEAPSYQNTLNTNAISTSNYWQPVDIALAMASNTVAYNNSQFDTSKTTRETIWFFYPR